MSDCPSFEVICSGLDLVSKVVGHSEAGVLKFLKHFVCVMFSDLSFQNLEISYLDKYPGLIYYLARKCYYFPFL